jgi:hypothetical protein
MELCMGSPNNECQSTINKGPCEPLSYEQILWSIKNRMDASIGFH